MMQVWRSHFPDIMPSPFPGMDPYLEHPDLWQEVHSRLIVGLADAIAPPLLPDYYVAIEKRTYFTTPEESLLVGIPDVAVLAQKSSTARRDEGNISTATLSKPNEPQTVTIPLAEEVQERYLEIRETTTGAVVTVIELLSPKNKRSGEGREAYLSKRQRILTSATHLVEIDLLRGGIPMPMEGATETSHYRILISRSHARPQAQLYAFNLQDPIPSFPLPLKSDDSPLQIDLKPILDNLYDRAGYQFRLAYDRPPVPALSQTENTWIEARLRDAG